MNGLYLIYLNLFKDHFWWLDLGVSTARLEVKKSLYFCNVHMWYLFTLEKSENSIMRNWWNYNGMKENSIPLSGISMG